MRGDGPGQDSRVRLPSLGGHEVRLQDAACSPVTADEFVSRGADPTSGAGRLMEGSVK